ncbi:MAG: AAA family ATPase [Actinomycetota bacterium]|nr:AAA family ATPase [Actinomycetota bacterium]
MSTGNRRKVGLIGAFMSRPDLLILDEPTKGLDPLVQAEFLQMVREVNAAGTTVFLSSHDLGEVQRVADRAAVLRQGRLVADDSIENLRHAARQRFEAYFDGPVPSMSSPLVTE